MSDKLLDKYTGRRFSNSGEPDGGSEVDGSEDLNVFGWLRAPRDRAVMVELRKGTGNILAVGYGYIDRIEFSPSEAITLHCGDQKIKIRGRNLNGEIRPAVRLFSGLARHRVTWIAEADPSSKLQASKNAVIVESIEW
jgi:hypothetical protein